MTDSEKTPDLSSQSSLATRRDQMFPALSGAQLARLQRYGQRRDNSSGAILAEPGDRGLPMWVVLSGSIEAVQVGMAGETTVVTHNAGGFTGEMSTLRGISSMVRMRVCTDGEVSQIDESRCAPSFRRTRSSASSSCARSFFAVSGSFRRRRRRRRSARLEPFRRHAEAPAIPHA